MAVIAPIDVAPRGSRAGETFELHERRLEGLAIVRVAGVGLHADHQTFSVGHRDRNLGAELVLFVCLALGDAGDLGGMQGGELVLGAALLRQQPLDRRERLAK
jgi:hypothetical protein